MRIQHLAILVQSVALAGCAQPSAYPPDSPHYAYPAGVRLVLERAVDIPPDAATVRFQYGQPVARNGVREEDPYCIFEVNTVAADSQRVAPDTLRVTAIERRIETFAGMPAWPGFTRFGLHERSHHGRRVVFDDDDGPSQIYYVTRFRLASAAQPDVRALTCQHNQMMPGVAIMRHVTLPEIRGALGAWFTLELAP